MFFIYSNASTVMHHDLYLHDALPIYSTPAYWPALELLGWPEVGPRLQRRTREGRWAEMAEGVTDAMMEKIVPRGSYEDIAGGPRGRYAGLASGIAFPMRECPADGALA